MLIFFTKMEFKLQKLNFGILGNIQGNKSAERLQLLQRLEVHNRWNQACRNPGMLEYNGIQLKLDWVITCNFDHVIKFSKIFENSLPT